MIDAILDPFAINTSFKNPFPDELDRARMGLEMSFFSLEWNSTGPIKMSEIRNGLCLSSTPISLNAMRQPSVLSNANALNPPSVSTSGAIGMGEFRGEEAGYNCDPY